MPITMGGMASGLNTDEIITKLVEVEAQPIRQMQTEIGEYSQKKSALEKLSGKLKSLERATKDLYGFRSTYDEKSVESSHPHLIEATASQHATKGTRYLTVMELAGTHKISTDRLEKKPTL
jgi:flagellar hook-associated protein 2